MRSKKYLLIKIALVLFLVIYLTLIYTADHAKNISMDAITSSMETDSTITQLVKRDRADLKHFYQISDNDTEGFFFYKAASPMSVDEILIVKAANKSQANAFLESMESHLASQKNVFGGYGTDQMALLGNAITETRGNYAYYMCGADAASWRETFLSLIS